jgi:aryl-alcohol dehydrogenase-like predicted oxidoreductase
MAKWKERLQRFDTDRSWALVDTLRAVSSEVGASCAAVALAWLRDRPAVTSVILGVRDRAQLEDNLVAADLRLPVELAARLDAVSALTLDSPYDFIRNIDGAW